MKRLFCLFAATAALLPQIVHADSLFPGSSTAVPTTAATSSLFSDNKARRVGDVLTILISEAASASSQAETKTGKTENIDYGTGWLGGLSPLQFLTKKLGVSSSISGGGSISSDGTGSTNRADNLTAQITVRVKNVLPDGNLEVEGTRQVGMNAETQTITLSGVVRPQDVTFDNTVQSSLVADAQIKFGGRGPVGDKQHDGIISRIFKFLF